jgi:hypothetical protein
MMSGWDGQMTMRQLLLLSGLSASSYVVVGWAALSILGLFTQVIH